MKPFIKYPGGKYSVMGKVLEVLPQGKRLIDVFCGGGAVFLNAPHEIKIAADINSNLIDMYKAVKEDPDFVLLMLKEIYKSFNSRDGYYEVREMFNEPDTVGGMTGLKAAQLIYLSHHCYNGMMRFSKKENKFNVPYGKKDNPYLPEQEIKYFSAMANECQFYCQEYAQTIGIAGVGDVIVCDPPYQPVEGSKMFNSYSGGAWGMAKQEDLVKHMMDAYNRGAALVVFNSAAKCIRELYADYGFTLHDLPTRRSVGASAKSRTVANDVLGVMVHE